MSRVLEAIYEGGVLKPLEDPGLAEHQRVLLEIQATPESAPTSLEAWRRVYAGLSEGDLAEVEAIAMDRSHFSRQDC